MDMDREIFPLTNRVRKRSTHSRKQKSRSGRPLSDPMGSRLNKPLSGSIASILRFPFSYLLSTIRALPRPACRLPASDLQQRIQPPQLTFTWYREVRLHVA